MFGTAPAAWGWADGGTFSLTDTGVEIRLVDLTGCDGRCDALFSPMTSNSVAYDVRRLFGYFFFFGLSLVPYIRKLIHVD